MLRFIAGIWCLSSAAFAHPAEDAVEIAGVRYRTGFLQHELPVDTQYVAPSLDEIDELPESYDAREHGLVTRIKNQGNCGSCWAFARTKALEAAVLKNAAPSDLNLSEQDILVNDHRSFGCGGGRMEGHFEVSRGLTSEALCPYRASGDLACDGAKYAWARRWAMIGRPNRAPTVDELRAVIVAHGVIVVNVAAGASFTTNAEGRITTCDATRVNHMVNLAGYRPAPDGGYEFLIANSWGTGWGEAGFAWSKQGCNALASSEGGAALLFFVEQDAGR